MTCAWVKERFWRTSCTACCYAPLASTDWQQHGSNVQPDRGARPDAHPDASESRRAAGAAGAARDDDVADSASAAGCALHVQHRARAGGCAGGGVFAAPAGICPVSDHSAGGDVAAPGAQRRVHAGRLARGTQGTRRGGPRHSGVRRGAGRWQLRGRPGGVHHPRHHQLRGRHQGCGTRLRGQRTVHPGRHARQADGHRCGSERRSDQSGRGADPARRRWPRSRLLRGDGWRQQVCAGRRGGGHPDHDHQRPWRTGDRRRAARHGIFGGAARLHTARHWRRSGRADPLSDPVSRGGDHGHAGQHRAGHRRPGQSGDVH